MADVFDLTVRVLSYPVSLSLLLNALDDGFVDLAYYLKGLHRIPSSVVDIEGLRSVEPQRIAILIPAWDEAAVIGEVLAAILRTTDYPLDRYDIFVGTYPNDPDTQRAVAGVQWDNVHQVVGPNAGPTTKADCLNSIVRGVRAHEGRLGRYAMFLLQDAEDLLHPLALRVYNAAVPAHDFVQTPVLPLEQAAFQMVAGTYADEFAEAHLKELPVRSALGGLVPSAGVGTALARDAFDEVLPGGEPFDPESLTEDYVAGVEFHLAGRRCTFLLSSVLATRRGSTVEEIVATREYFPDEFRAAARQRARWILGVALQSARRFRGRRRDLMTVWCLWRDSKVLLTAATALGGYTIALYSLARLLHGSLVGAPWSFDRLYPPGTALWWVVVLLILPLAWRVTLRVLLVHRVYGAVHAALSIPRYFILNVVNGAASAIAVTRWTAHRLWGAPLRWEKTDHRIPRT